MLKGVSPSPLPELETIGPFLSAESIGKKAAISWLSHSQTPCWHEMTRLKLGDDSVLYYSINRYTLWSMAPIELWDRSIMAHVEDTRGSVMVVFYWQVQQLGSHLPEFYELSWHCQAILLWNFVLSSTKSFIKFMLKSQSHKCRKIVGKLSLSDLSASQGSPLVYYDHKFQAFHSCSITSHVYSVQNYEIMICVMNNLPL